MVTCVGWRKEPRWRQCPGEGSEQRGESQLGYLDSSQPSENKPEPGGPAGSLLQARPPMGAVPMCSVGVPGRGRSREAGAAAQMFV